MDKLAAYDLLLEAHPLWTKEAGVRAAQNFGARQLARNPIRSAGQMSATRPSLLQQGRVKIKPTRQVPVPFVR